MIEDNRCNWTISNLKAVTQSPTENVKQIGKGDDAKVYFERTNPNDGKVHIQIREPNSGIEHYNKKFPASKSCIENKNFRSAWESNRWGTS